MNAFSFPSWLAQCLGLAGVIVAGAGPRVVAEPFVPKDDAQVLERLRLAPLDAAGRELRALRTQWAAHPTNLAVAVPFAWRCLERSRADGDPRYLGRAQSAIAPWWDLPQPPLDALILRATIKQSQHQFPAALTDLDLVLRLGAQNAQAWLTRTTVLTVLGRFPEARRACLPLARLAPELVAVTAAANIASLTGQAERSTEMLRRALNRNGSAPLSERLWALTMLAETAARLGQAAEADSNFQRALGLGECDTYLLASYADFLLDQGRNKEVCALLKEQGRVDPLLLRLALAESSMLSPPASLGSHVDALCARFEASRLRGDSVHQREEARFTLGLLRQPRQALRLAEANWQVQREPADARILMESALASKDPRAAAPALEFVRTNRLEDVSLSKLAVQLDTLNP